MSNRITKGTAIFGSIAVKSSIKLNGVAFTTASAAASLLAGLTNGIVTASKGVVVDANKAISGLVFAIGTATTTTAAKPVGYLSDSTSTTSGTTQNTEYPINNVTLPANAMTANGDGVQVVAWGTTAANANAKTLKLYFGTTVVATVTGNTGNNVPWSVDMTVIRTGTGAQSYFGEIGVNGTYTQFAGTCSETETATILIKTASINTAAAAASATGLGMVVENLT